MAATSLKSSQFVTKFLLKRLKLFSPLVSFLEYLGQMEAISLNICAYCGAQTPNERFCCSGCEVLSQKFTRLAQTDLNSYLDQSNFKDFYKLKTGNYDYQLYIQGIHCSACVHLIEKLPLYDTSIEFARVDYAQSKLFLKVKAHFSLAQLLLLLSSFGYSSRFLKADESIQNWQTQENKIFLKKLGVAGACAGNIMLFTIPIYSGLAGRWQVSFNWLSFFLFLPIIFYSGTPFYKSAWNALKLRILNIDLPITVALLTGFTLSTVNLVRGQGDIYYDSTASFIFLILGARYFLKRSQQKFLAATQIEDWLNQDIFIRLDHEKRCAINLKEIQTNDVLELTSGQISPVDGTIESDAALVDISVLNGEPLPRRFEKGMLVLAGSRILNKSTLVKVFQPPAKTHLASILQQLQEGLREKSKFVALTDRLAQKLIITVFTTAVVFFVIYFNYNPQEAFNRALALIILACPCALALGTPLAFSLAIKKAQAQGILIKNPESLEKILKLKNIFFDKTGTLTQMDLQLTKTMPFVLQDKIKSLILSLEQKSYHPIAFALRQAWPDIKPLSVTHLQEQIGQGVSGFINSHFYEIVASTPSAIDDLIRLDVKEDGVVICTLCFENLLCPESFPAAKVLSARGLTCFILSGDAQARVDHIAQLTGIDADKAHGELSVAQKKERILSTKHSCMIGDGTNDALALQAADVGIAIKGSTFINMQAADICFTRGGLQPLIELFNLAQSAQRTLIRNLTFSLVYNLIGATLALTGYVSPWLAALLMPFSSLIILLSTLWGIK